MVFALLAKLAKAAATAAPERLLVAVKVKPPTVKLWPVAMGWNDKVAVSVTLVTVVST